MIKLSVNHVRVGLIVTVCGAQFYVSASDIIDVALPIVHSQSRAVMFPACIDLMILVATLTVAAPKGVNKAARVWATAGRYVGFAFTVYANALAGGILNASHITPAVVGATIFMLAPALALICTLEMAVHAAQGTPATRAATTAAKATRAPRKAPVKATEKAPEKVAVRKLAVV